ncbi:MAG: glycoside hydrolase family 20 zincin-like fold domain-containing protein [Verrucomicrobiae bacterium]|nr:glycoside hydrolase family 20 zincin-like fold domain-containing protein [Verrucomicrobiae bacterium]
MNPILLLAPLAALAGSLELVNDPATGAPGRFAAEEIRREAQARGITLRNDAAATRVVLTVEQQGCMVPQSYRIRVQNDGGRRAITVRGGDAVGAMYGGLDIAEAIHTGSLDALKDSDHIPHIAQRGIKFNIPLDVRTPTYQAGEWPDSARLNVAEMWSRDFWRELLDDMARHRYNVLTLWNMNPFPSIVKVPEFPNTALDDVFTTDEAGKHLLVKKMTIDDKIQFWREVMQLAKDRGVDVYWFTWNVFTRPVEGKDGITPRKTDQRTIEYFRASVRETIKTYPLLAGLGITAGELMPNDEFPTTSSKEQWLWQTYGEGVRDALKESPNRKFRLIHRFHMSDLTEIERAFAKLPCPLEFSFKYAIAHMYSIPNPPFIKRILPQLGPQRRCWLTVRNDDIHSFRWADYEYARAFIKAIPNEDKIVGFYMGPDGYHWGRDFLTKNPDGPRQTIMQKMWLSFALWGRLAYDPDLPATTFERLIAARFPGADAPQLMAAWAAASKTFPYITRFFWGAIDIKWFPEACRSRGRFYTVRSFIEGETMPGSGVLSITEWRNALLKKQPLRGVTPLEIATTLQLNATQALEALPALQQANITPPARAKEYLATLNDIEAMAHLGLYYAAKIRGACDLALFDKTADPQLQASAIQHLEAALTHWKNYAAAYTRQYIQPVLYNRAGLVDIPKQTEDVTADIQMARAWKPRLRERPRNANP